MLPTDCSAKGVLISNALFDLAQKLVDCLMRIRGEADALSRPQERYDRLRRRERFARPGRPLNEEIAVVKLVNSANNCVRQRLPLLLDRHAPGAALEPRRVTQQDVEHRPVGVQRARSKSLGKGRNGIRLNARDGILARIEAFCRSLAEFADVGSRHDERFRGLRSVGVPGLKTVLVLFVVGELQVTVIRIGYLRRNIWDDIDSAGIRTGAPLAVCAAGCEWRRALIRPANLKVDQIDRRRAEHQTGKRRVVIVARERQGRTITTVTRSEADGVAFVEKLVTPGTVIHADEAGHWDALHTKYATRRINHQYSWDGACTNQAVSFLARLRRRVGGQHHHVSPQSQPAARFLRQASGVSSRCQKV
jgi:hypothetical protein